MTRYWRLRMKDGSGRDLSEDAWERNEVGIWYGAWSAEDFISARSRLISSADIAAELNELPSQQALKWPVGSGYVDAARRFSEISEKDWVVLYLGSAQEIALAKVRDAICSNTSHPFNSNGELFKYREIVDKKKFRISALPDAYRLLPSQGRGNVHEFNNMWEHVKLLAENQTELDINKSLSEKPFDELLDLLGASAWESFCFAYLIIEQDFVPTGLSTGRTLPIADIIGRRRNDGSRIVAQCKKHPTAQPLDPEFRNLSASLAPNDSAYYFAYGGCTDHDPRIQIIDRNSALEWAKSKTGTEYKNLLLRT